MVLRQMVFEIILCHNFKIKWKHSHLW